MEKDKLTIELVPKSSWGNNLRHFLPRHEWDSLRKSIYESYDNKCGICDSAVGLHCHEEWEYDDVNKIQTLVRLVALCELCHHVKHLGHALILAQRSNFDFEKVILHFTKVNGCTRDHFWKVEDEAFDIWAERSVCDWTVCFGEYSSLVSSFVGVKKG